MKHRKKRKPVRDSARVYNARAMKAMLAKAYLLVPGAHEALEEFRRHLSDYDIDPPPPEVIVIGLLTTRSKHENALGLQLKGTRHKGVFIDAARCGNISRMMNHFCDATCQFVEVRNRRQVKVVVVAKGRIGDSKDVTVDYKCDLWFTCCCGSRCCVAGQASQKNAIHVKAH